MNHWFLCARDVMWVLIAVAPMYLSFYSGTFSERREEDLAVSLNVVGAFIQLAIIVALYFGLIR